MTTRGILNENIRSRQTEEPNEEGKRRRDALDQVGFGQSVFYQLVDVVSQTPAAALVEVEKLDPGAFQKTVLAATRGVLPSDPPLQLQGHFVAEGAKGQAQPASLRKGNHSVNIGAAGADVLKSSRKEVERGLTEYIHFGGDAEILNGKLRAQLGPTRLLVLSVFRSGLVHSGENALQRKHDLLPLFFEVRLQLPATEIA